MIGDLGLTALYESCAERGDMCDGMRDRHPYAHPGARSACRGPCSLPGSLPWRRERPAWRVRRFPTRSGSWTGVPRTSAGPSWSNTRRRWSMPATRQAESNSVTSCGCGDSMPTPPETQLPGGTRHCSRPGPRRHAAGRCCPFVPSGLVSWRPWLEDRALR